MNRVLGLTVLALVLWGRAPAMARPDQARADAIAATASSVEALGTAWHVVHVIENLEGRYGTFGDLDGDGDDDYVATEMLHGPERITTYLSDDAGWRRVDQGGRELQSRHPLLPWILSDDGSGHAAIVVPTGWPPYITVYATDGAGHLGPHQSLQPALPPRISKPMGVDNNPYTITAVVPASKGRPAEVHGVLEDTDGERELRKSWRVRLRPGATPRRRSVRHLNVPGPEFDTEALPVTVRVPGGAHACDHVDPRRSAILHSTVFDVDRDGHKDLVHVAADFAAHVFRGHRELGAALSFRPAHQPARPIPLGEARWWLGQPRQATGDWQIDGPRMVKSRGFTFFEAGTEDVPLMVVAGTGLPYVASYVWTGRTLAPVYRARRRWPQPSMSHGAAEQIPEMAETRFWREVWRDATGDGSPDSLAVGVSRDFDFVGHWRDGKKRFRHGGQARASIVFWEGESDRYGARRVVQFPMDVEVPADWHMGLPIDLEPVRVEGPAGRERWCIYVRPWRVGFFLERDEERVGDRAARQARRASRWWARGDEFLRERHALDACDTSKCMRGRRLSAARIQDAVACFARAAEYAEGLPLRARAHHGRARGLSLLEDVPGARAAYEAYVAAGGVPEHPDTAHADLDALVSDEAFEAYLRRLSKEGRSRSQSKGGR